MVIVTENTTARPDDARQCSRVMADNVGLRQEGCPLAASRIHRNMCAGKGGVGVNDAEHHQGQLRDGYARLYMIKASDP
jgi:hypothetical protein